MNDSKKRNRLGNFDQDDIDIFLNLVNSNKSLIESGKQEDKKKGWDQIEEGFNANCTGIKRDIGALKMKLKNLKAQNRLRVKTEDGSAVERLDEFQGDSEQDASVNDTSPKNKISRKRSKVWTAEETNQLVELVEKHFHCLDTSLTRESLELRNQAWDTIVEEFNRSKGLGIQRDINELKIKLKNMKAKRTNFKTESESGQEAVDQTFIEVEQIPEEVVKVKRTKVQASTPILHNDAPSARSHRSSLPAPSRYAPKVKTFELILDSLDPINDYSDEDDYPQPIPKKQAVSAAPGLSAEDKEEARIRKENLLLKTSVLRKKERLLELQIALAERNLRRHQLQ